MLEKSGTSYELKQTAQKDLSTEQKSAFNLSTNSAFFDHTKELTIETICHYLPKDIQQLHDKILSVKSEYMFHIHVHFTTHMQILGSNCTLINPCRHIKRLHRSGKIFNSADQTSYSFADTKLVA